jgi:L-ascorbate metabolism protein UlaG (beta-lactamase superfamily)
MVITWYGQACFKIQSGDLVIAIDPFAKEIGLTPPRFRADLALVTHSHYDHSNTASLAGDPFVVSGPGEYEVKGAVIRGIQTVHDRVLGKERGLNTAYRLEVEGIALVHMGDFGEERAREETLELLGDVDVLFVPVGGTYTIDAQDAARVTKQIEPAFVVPMHYKLPGVKADLAGVEPFLKEMGSAKAEPAEKLVLKKKDIPEESRITVVVLKPA